MAGCKACVIWALEGWQVSIQRQSKVCCICKILYTLLDHGTEFIGNGADDRMQLSDSSIVILITSNFFMLCTLVGECVRATEENVCWIAMDYSCFTWFAHPFVSSQ